MMSIKSIINIYQYTITMYRTLLLINNIKVGLLTAQNQNMQVL